MFGSSSVGQQPKTSGTLNSRLVLQRLTHPNRPIQRLLKQRFLFTIMLFFVIRWCINKAKFKWIKLQLFEELKTFCQTFKASTKTSSCYFRDSLTVQITDDDTWRFVWTWGAEPDLLQGYMLFSGCSIVSGHRRWILPVTASGQMKNWCVCLFYEVLMYVASKAMLRLDLMNRSRQTDSKKSG